MQLSKRALFYLETHYCGETTGKFEGNTPIMDEIAILLNEEKFKHEIVIDDARMYLNIDGYPSIRTLRK